MLSLEEISPSRESAGAANVIVTDNATNALARSVARILIKIKALGCYNLNLSRGTFGGIE
jgi:hypothetical protein